MNGVTAIASLVTLLVGGAVGYGINQVGEPSEIRGNQFGRAQMVDMTMPDPIDYVSTRPAVSALPASDLSEAEESGLIFMREEEKLTRDVYMTLYDKWGLRIFSNIAQSEQTHTEAVRDLLVKYDVTDPVTDDSIGVFADPILQNLYDDLVEQGSVSIEEALKVGALIEDLDISDLQEEVAKTDNEDIQLVYENLMRGSRNHLRAFTKQLESYSESYDPQYLSQDEYDEIVGSERETGNGMSSGQGGQGARGGAGQGRSGGGVGRGWGGR